MEYDDRDPGGRDFRGRSGLAGICFRHCDLRDALFQGATLDGADFTDSDLEGAQLQDASLKGANLSEVRNLSAEALGGADLTGARIPPGWNFEGLNGVAESSKYFQSLFKLSLALAAFSALTIFSTPDELLILKESTHGTTLPFISATIAPRHFGWIAPLILLTLFTYLMTYLADTWVQLSKLPASFPDGTPLDRRAYPLSLNCLIRKYFMRLRDTPPIAYEMLIAYTFMFGVCLPTLFAFWLSYLKLHSWPISLAQGLWFSIALQMALYHRVVSIVVLGEKGWRTGEAEWGGKRPAPWLRRINPWQIDVARMLMNEGKASSGFGRLFLYSIWPGVACFALLSGLSGLAFSSPSFRIDIGNKVLCQVIVTDGQPIVAGADLEGIDLRHADASGAYLRRADLKSTTLVDADFSGATLTGADFRGADLTRTILTGAEISGCDFTGTGVSPEQIKTAQVPDRERPPRLPVGMESPWPKPGTASTGQTATGKRLVFRGSLPPRSPRLRVRQFFTAQGTGTGETSRCMASSHAPGGSSSGMAFIRSMKAAMALAFRACSSGVMGRTRPWASLQGTKRGAAGRS